MISEVIGMRLKKIREERGYSLEKVSELTGVSKPSINNIERGLTSPSIDSLWKIATGLSVPISYFFSEFKTAHTLVNMDELTKIDSKDELVSISSIFSWLPTDNFECFYLELAANANRVSQAHVKGSKELIFILEGQLTMLLGEERIVCKENACLKFDANIAHTYFNETDAKVRGISVMIYPADIDR